MTQNKKSTRYYSQQQENYVANLVGGKSVPNSGATNYQKGDVSTTGEDSWLLECKTCIVPKQSFAIKKEWLKVLKQEAIGQGKINYALVFNFGPNQENYYILTEDKFKQLFEVDE